MTQTLDPTSSQQNACGCCAGVSAHTPQPIDNPPGLSQVAYRLGTHSRFFQTMLARLSSAQYPGLANLTTRATDDPTIALLDACAVVDDVLTFYEERYGQEKYLRTALERVSLVELARLIGYEPRPGVAANVTLAFTIESTPGAPETTPIPAGTRVQSIPGPDELPQTFETMAAITARASWNAMKARTRQPHPLRTDLKEVLVKGIEVAIKRGDSLLIVAGAARSQQAVKRVLRVIPDPATQTTRLILDEPAPPTAPVLTGATSSPFLVTLAATLNDATLGTLFSGKVYKQSDTQVYGVTKQWSEVQYATAVNTVKKPPPPTTPPDTGIFALRQRAALFGHNAPTWKTLPQVVEGRERLVAGMNLTADEKTITNGVSKAQYPVDWDNATLTGPTVDLDNLYPAMIPDSWIVLESPAVESRPFRVTANGELTRNDYTLSAKVTRLNVEENGVSLTGFAIRTTTVLGQSEELTLADLELAGPLSGDTITLDQFYPGLAVGQTIILTGERADLAGVIEHEVRTIKEALADGGLEPESGRVFTRLILDQPLAFSYVLNTVTINANAVLATHGESKAEVLGSGDASQGRQRFLLKQPPLTYISAATPTGTQSTLAVRVDDLLWQEVPNLYNRRPEERVYSVQIDDDGRTVIQFGAPLPTGQENVRATYRKGIGLAGLVKADQLTLLAVRPLGVRAVTNPLPASGAEDPESLTTVRRNAPLTVLTLDRLVSLVDYEDFARAFAGFAKARATLTVEGQRQGIFLTVAGVNGAVVDEASAEFANLIEALQTFSDPNVSVVVKSYRPAFFQVEAQLIVDPAHEEEKVVAAVEAALRGRFSFEARDFGQPVPQSEVIGVIQALPGVVAVDLNRFFRTDTGVATLEDRLTAAQPTPGLPAAQSQPAELLLLDPRPVQLLTVRGV